jgi:hypothetical protein
MVPVDPGFLDAIIDVANGMRLAAHNCRHASARFETDGATEVLNGLQCRARISSSDGVIALSVEPFAGAADDFEAVSIRMQTRFLGGSPLLDAKPSADGRMLRTFAGLFDPIQNGGEVKAIDFGGEPFGLLVETMDRRRADRAALVDRLIRGTDAIAGGKAHMLVRHPAMGAAASAVPVNGDGQPFTIPETGNGSPMDAQLERISMIATWSADLPQALMLRRIGDRLYDVAPLGYTYAPAPDPHAARGEAMVAYAKLHAMGRPER